MIINIDPEEQNESNKSITNTKPKKSFHPKLPTFKKHTKKQKVNEMDDGTSTNDDIIKDEIIDVPPKSKKSKSIFHKSVKVKKHKASNEVTTDKFNVETVQLHYVQQQLKFPSTLIGTNELKLMLKMDTKIKVINGIMKNRFLTSVAFIFFGILISFFVKKYQMVIIIAGLALAFVTWTSSMKRTKSYYQIYAINRQIAFTEFRKTAGALLTQLNKGENLLSVFDEVSQHMDNDGDRNALKRLMAKMQSGDTSNAPFIEFAHRFSTNDRAELTMLYMYQMYLGNTDTSGIQSLINDANDDYRNQTKQIIEMKIQRFYSTSSKIVMSVSLIIFGYFGIYIVHMFQHIFSVMSKVNF